MTISRRQTLGIAAASAVFSVVGGAATGAEFAIRSERSDQLSAMTHGATSRQRPGLLWRLPIAPVSGNQAVTVTAANDAVYLLSNTELYALAADNGRTMWKYSPSDSNYGNLFLGDGVIYLSAFSTKANYDGCLTALNVNTGRELWRKTLINAGFSNPICDGKTIYLSAAPPTSGPGLICALDARDGRSIWQLAGVGDTIRFTGGNNSYTDVTSVDVPVFSRDNTLYTASKYKLHARNKNTGEEVWAFPFPQANNDGGPLLSGDAIYIISNIDASNSRSQMLKIDATTGQQLWASGVPGGSFLMNVRGDTVFAVSGGSGISAFAAASGSIAWAKNSSSIGSSLAVTNDVVLISRTPSNVNGGVVSPGNSSGETELCALRSTDGQIKWKNVAAGSFLTSNPVLVGDWACVGFWHKSICVLNRSSGKIRWSWPAPVVYGPVVNGDILYVTVADEVSANGNASLTGALCAMKI